MVDICARAAQAQQAVLRQAGVLLLLQILGALGQPYGSSVLTGAEPGRAGELFVNFGDAGRDCMSSPDPIKSRSVRAGVCYRGGSSLPGYQPDHTFEAWAVSGTKVTRRVWVSTPGCSGDTAAAAGRQWPEPDSETNYSTSQWCNYPGFRVAVGETPSYRRPPTANATDDWAPRWVNNYVAVKSVGVCDFGNPTGQGSYMLGSCYNISIGGNEQRSVRYVLVRDGINGGVRGDRVNSSLWMSSDSCAGAPSSSTVRYAGVDTPRFGNCVSWSFSQHPEYPSDKFPTRCANGVCCCDAALDQACQSTRVSGLTSESSQQACLACTAQAQVELEAAGCSAAMLKAYCSASASCCTDLSPDWSVSFLGSSHNCSQFGARHYCSPYGGYGQAWASVLGTFDDWQHDGFTATQACCACGGGSRGPGGDQRGPAPPPPLSAQCQASQADRGAGSGEACRAALNDVCEAAVRTRRYLRQHAPPPRIIVTVEMHDPPTPSRCRACNACKALARADRYLPASATSPGLDYLICARLVMTRCVRSQRRASSGNCFVCAGSHQHRLQVAQCSNADIDQFCSKRT
jgi:hypothetical protein